MKFNSEKERLSHSAAKLIPFEMWVDRQLFNKELSDKDEYFLTASMETLLSDRNQIVNYTSIHRAILLILIRFPNLDLNSLLSCMKSINTTGSFERGIFLFAAALGNEQLVDELLKNDDIDQRLLNKAFCLAAKNGRVGILQYFKDKVSTDQFEEMIRSGEQFQVYQAFSDAAENGHLDVLEWFAKHTPKSLDDMIVSNKEYTAFRAALRSGNLDVVKWFTKNVDTELLLIMLTKCISSFSDVAEDGYLDVLKWINKQVPVELHDKMIKNFDFRAFRYAVKNKHPEIVAYLLSFPTCFSYAEQHVEEYGAQYVNPFIRGHLASLHNKIQAFSLEQPNAVFDILDTEEAKLYFYMLRNLIRRNDRDFDDEIRFLLNIPAVKALAHQAVTPNRPNELVRLALTTGNTEAASILLNVEAVRELAEQNNFYSNEQQGRFDLRQLAQDRESSMTALSIGEQKRLDAAIKEYNPTIEKNGVSNLMDEIRIMLLKRYQKNPANITINNSEITLPADWNELQKLNLDKDNYAKALKAYYQHKDHSALRYLSKPNHWMHPNASYVYVNEKKTERWSTFEEYQPLIVMLWLAAVDEKATPTDDMTLEGRLEPERSTRIYSYKWVSN